MSYLKMLGLGARGKLPGAAGLFSTAVISGSSSAPNLRVMIPTATSSNTALEGFGGVPAIRPLETLHNALSLRQLDAFLERVSAPVQLGTPPAPPAPAPPPPPPPHKQPSPTNSAGWSGPSSLMSSSGELPSGLSSAEPSSPNSNYASNSDHNKNNSSESSNWSKQAARPEWERAALCLAAALAPAPGSSISGDVTPVSAASELEFHSNEATAGSITDHDILSAEGEDDEETLSVDAGGSPGRVIRNDLSRRAASPAPAPAPAAPAEPAPPPSLYGLSYHDIKDTFYKDMPSSSKNYNVDNHLTSKCTKDPLLYTDIESLNLQRKDSRSKAKKHELLNNGSRRYSDGSAQKCNLNSTVSGSRFTTTLVSEDTLRPGSPGDSKSNDNLVNSEPAADGPLVTKARPGNIKRGFNITHNNIE